jgi:hypothetical protein
VGECAITVVVVAKQRPAVYRVVQAHKVRLLNLSESFQFLPFLLILVSRSEHKLLESKKETSGMTMAISNVRDANLKDEEGNFVEIVPN